MSTFPENSENLLSITIIYAKTKKKPNRKNRITTFRETYNVQFLYIPPESFGSVLGSKGKNIRDIMRCADCSVFLHKQLNWETESNVTTVAKTPEGSHIIDEYLSRWRRRWPFSRCRLKKKKTERGSLNHPQNENTYPHQSWISNTPTTELVKIKNKRNKKADKQNTFIHSA